MSRYCGGTSTPESTETQTIHEIKGAMHNHDEMVILCTKMVLGMSHKLNGTPKINIAINGLDSIFNLVNYLITQNGPVLEYEFYMHENDIIR